MPLTRMPGSKGRTTNAKDEVVWDSAQRTWTDPAQPTWIEARMYHALRVLGVRYAPQYPVGVYTLDAFLPDYGIALESLGCSWHGCATCFGADPIEVAQQARKTARRTEQLRLRFGIRTINPSGPSLNSD